MSTRQYARLLGSWLHQIGLDPALYGTHSLRRTKATLIYKRTGNLRAVQLLLAFPTEHRARAAAVSLSQRSSEALRWRRGGTHDRYAYAKAGVAGTGPYVVVTVVTATGKAGGRGPEFHRVLHADTLDRFAALYGS